MLIVLGVAVNLGTALQHSRVLGQLGRGEPINAGRWSLSIIVAYLLAGN